MPTKDKTIIRYFIIFLICLICIYTRYISNLFVPLFMKVYYGQLVELFKFALSAILWAIELIILCYFTRKKWNINLLMKKNKTTYSIKRIIILYLIVLIPILIISASLGFKLKIEYDFGERITTPYLIKQLCKYGSMAIQMIFIVIMIEVMQIAFDKIIITKYKIPWGGIIVMLTYGLIELIIDFSLFSGVYLLFCGLYGLIYIVSNERNSITYILSYILYLL